MVSDLEILSNVEIDIQDVHKQNRQVYRKLLLLKERLAKNTNTETKTLEFHFNSHPLRFKNNVLELKSTVDSGLRTISCDHCIASIGLTDDRLLSHVKSNLWENTFLCGWANFGPKGTVADTIIDAESVSSKILQFINQREAKANQIDIYQVIGSDYITKSQALEHEHNTIDRGLRIGKSSLRSTKAGS